MDIPTYIMRNLERYGNCIIDEKDISLIPNIEKAIGKKVRLEKRESFYEKRGPMGTTSGITNETIYILFLK